MRLSKRNVVAAGLSGLFAAMMTLVAPTAPAHADPAHPSHPAATTRHASPGELAQRMTDSGVPVTLASVFPCDFLTHVCVKFNKSETKWVASHTGALQGGGIAGAAALCSKLPLPSPGQVACFVTVETAGGALADSFDNAAGKGKCVELHFTIQGLFLTHWKAEGC